VSEDERDLERISELELKLRELDSALAEIDHQLRRVGDRIEREGEHGAGAERDRLEQNRRLNARERDEVQAELERLRGS